MTLAQRKGLGLWVKPVEEKVNSFNEQLDIKCMFVLIDPPSAWWRASWDVRREAKARVSHHHRGLRIGASVLVVRRRHYLGLNVAHRSGLCLHHLWTYHCGGVRHLEPSMARVGSIVENDERFWEATVTS